MIDLDKLIGITLRELVRSSRIDYSYFYSPNKGGKDGQNLIAENIEVTFYVNRNENSKLPLRLGLRGDFPSSTLVPNQPVFAIVYEANRQTKLASPVGCDGVVLPFEYQDGGHLPTYEFRNTQYTPGRKKVFEPDKSAWGEVIELILVKGDIVFKFNQNVLKRTAKATFEFGKEEE